MNFRFKRTNFGAALLAAFLCMTIQLLILSVRSGGELHFDDLFFFMHYLGEGSLGAKVLDPFRCDRGFYQARELSYLFDAADAHFIAFLLKKHIVWFHSLCSLLLCGCMVFIQHYYTRKFFPKIPGILVTLISVFFVLQPGVTGLECFRSARYLTAAGLWGALFAAYACCRCGNFRSRAALVLSLLVMTLSGRQGFFFTAAIAGTTALVMLWQCRSRFMVSVRRIRFVVLAALGVSFFGVVNNLYITPALVRAVNGCAVDFAYQRDWMMSFKALLSGGAFLSGSIGSWFSSYSGAVSAASLTGLLLLSGVGLELCYRFRRCEGSRVFLTLIWCCALGAMCLCSASMFARRNFTVDGSCSVDFLVITLFLLTLTAAGGKKRFRSLLLAVFAVSICLRLGVESVGDRFAPPPRSFSGYNSGQYVLKEALRDPEFDEKRYLLPLRMELFLEFCRKNILTKQ